MTTKNRLHYASDDLLWRIADLDFNGFGDAALAELTAREQFRAEERVRIRRAFQWRAAA